MRVRRNIDTLNLIAQRLLLVGFLLECWRLVTYYAAYMTLEARTIWLPICLLWMASGDSVSATVLLVP